MAIFRSNQIAAEVLDAYHTQNGEALDELSDWPDYLALASAT